MCTSYTARLNCIFSCDVFNGRAYQTKKGKVGWKSRARCTTGSCGASHKKGRRKSARLSSAGKKSSLTMMKSNRNRKRTKTTGAKRRHIAGRAYDTGHGGSKATSTWQWVRITLHAGFTKIDWCCFYYFVRNSLVALLEALCARILFFRIVNQLFLTFFVCVCKVSNKAFLPPLSTRLLRLVVAIPLVCWLYMCACVCVPLYVHVKMRR